jgi:hypothetical protein
MRVELDAIDIRRVPEHVGQHSADSVVDADGRWLVQMGR